MVYHFFHFIAALFLHFPTTARGHVFVQKQAGALPKGPPSLTTYQTCESTGYQVCTDEGGPWVRDKSHADSTCATNGCRVENCCKITCVSKHDAEGLCDQVEYGGPRPDAADSEVGEDNDAAWSQCCRRQCASVGGICSTMVTGGIFNTDVLSRYAEVSRYASDQDMWNQCCVLKCDSVDCGLVDGGQPRPGVGEHAVSAPWDASDADVWTQCCMKTCGSSTEYDCDGEGYEGYEVDDAHLETGCGSHDEKCRKEQCCTDRNIIMAA